jgi:hypothetical protein
MAARAPESTGRAPHSRARPRLVLDQSSCQVDDESDLPRLTGSLRPMPAYSGTMDLMISL